MMFISRSFATASVLVAVDITSAVRVGADAASGISAEARSPTSSAAVETKQPATAKDFRSYREFRRPLGIGRHGRVFKTKRPDVEHCDYVVEEKFEKYFGYLH